ncbi:MAG: sigma-70 family RNA polymerase sigma factor [Armatimonadetes bacterium]|nr:sigma-70 family RNA polymerase sigma factor [Armatimonadota bacterium]
MDLLWDLQTRCDAKPISCRVLYATEQTEVGANGQSRMTLASSSDSRTEPDEEAKATELIVRAQRGEAQAFNRLMNLYRERVARLAYHRVGNIEEAQDLCQETFVRVYRALDTFDARRAFSPWLYRIAHHVILDYMRRRKVRPVLADPEPGESYESEPDPSAVNPQRSMLTQETLGEVQEAIQSLPENYRTVIVLRFLEDLSYAEVAEALNLTEANVMMRISRARRMLRDKLKHLQVENTHE